jgi:hypothetical protein
VVAEGERDIGSGCNGGRLSFKLFLVPLTHAELTDIQVALTPYRPT